MITRKNVEPMTVPAGAQPGLAKLVAEAAAPGSDPPALFHVTLAPGVWVESAGRDGGEDVLVVSLPLLATLPRCELRALIAQQLAQRDGREVVEAVTDEVVSTEPVELEDGHTLEAKLLAAAREDDEAIRPREKRGKRALWVAAGVLSLSLLAIAWVAAIVGLLMTMLGYVAWMKTPLALRRAHVGWSGDRLTITHPLLRAPFTVRAADLRLLATSNDDAARRFPVTPETSSDHFGDEGSGWLWTQALGSPLPTLGVRPDPPNVALLFEHPLPSPPMRHDYPFGPLKGEAMAGLLLRVDDVAVVERLERMTASRTSSTGDAVQLDVHAL
jgi:hypothetical protein